MSDTPNQSFVRHGLFNWSQMRILDKVCKWSLYACVPIQLATLLWAIFQAVYSRLYGGNWKNIMTFYSADLNILTGFIGLIFFWLLVRTQITIEGEDGSRQKEA